MLKYKKQTRHELWYYTWVGSEWFVQEGAEGLIIGGDVEKRVAFQHQEHLSPSLFQDGLAIVKEWPPLFLLCVPINKMIFFFFFFFFFTTIIFYMFLLHLCLFMAIYDCVDQSCSSQLWILWHTHRIDSNELWHLGCNAHIFHNSPTATDRLNPWIVV